MVIERFALLQGIGQFEQITAGAQIPLGRLSLVYAENGRGKTTLAAILRSVKTGDPTLVIERKRLGSVQDYRAVIDITGGQATFINGAWSATLPDVEIFDDAFVAANVCSGIEIESSHKQNLHELILGAQGVTLNNVVQGHIARIEQHNRELQSLQGRIPAQSRGGIAVDEFCALTGDPDIQAKIQNAERALAAAKSADAVVQRAPFQMTTLPALDGEAIAALLACTIPDVEAAALEMVQQHFQQLGEGGESWINAGMSYAAEVSHGGSDNCPFCAQELGVSPIIKHYQAYFSQAYDDLKSSIDGAKEAVAAAHGGEVPTAFERAVRMAVETANFWRRFLEIPNVEIDTAATVRAWTAARDAILDALIAKAASPLSKQVLPPETLAAIEAYHHHQVALDALFSGLVAKNAEIAIVKEKAAGANVVALTADLVRLRAIEARHSPAVAPHCDAYLAEKAAKVVTEGLRDQARAALDQYRTNVFPAYENAINEYLGRFNAGFRLGAVASVNNRSGSSANFSVVINGTGVNPSATIGPSFRNTLSAGDRNTLALAFFFASLDQDPQLAQKIVVIDDPMTSLDDHRSLTTVQEIKRLLPRVEQVIILSHSKPFLCTIWDNTRAVPARSSIRFVRAADGSELAVWDVNQDCITEHDRRHALISDYVRAANPATERQVAEALRPTLEAFLRVAYPANCPPGTLLGPFINICRQRLNTPNQILSANDLAELDALKAYGNRFHHDTNPAYQTAAINDQELLGFARRTMRFATRA